MAGMGGRLAPEALFWPNAEAAGHSLTWQPFLELQFTPQLCGALAPTGPAFMQLDLKKGKSQVALEESA